MPDVIIDQLEQIALAKSDNQAAEQMNNAQILFLGSGQENWKKDLRI